MIMILRRRSCQSCSQVFDCHKLFLRSPMVDLGSEFIMTWVERRECLTKHCKANAIDVVKDSFGQLSRPNDKYIQADTIELIINQEGNSVIGFPQACTLFTSNLMFTQQGVAFFKNANAILCGNISNIRKEGYDNRQKMVDYTLLVYMLVNKKIIDLNADNLENVNDVCSSIYGNRKEALRIHEIEDSIVRLKCGYLRQSHTHAFTFQHRSIFEAVLLSYNNFDKEKMIKLMDFDFIVELTRPEYYVGTQSEVFLTIHRKDYKVLANHLLRLLFFCPRPFYFVRRLMNSLVIRHSGVELVMEMASMYYSNENIPSNLRELQIVEINTNDLIFNGFDFVISCLLFCDKNDGLISYLCELNKRELASASPTNSKLIFPSFLFACCQKDKLKAKLFWELIKRHGAILFDDNDQVNIKRLSINTYIEVLLKVIDDWTWLGSDIIDEILLQAVSSPDEDVAISLLKKLDPSLINAKIAMKSACKVGSGKIFKKLLRRFDHGSSDEAQALNEAVKSGNLNIVRKLFHRVEQKYFDAKTALNKACRLGHLELVNYFLHKYKWDLRLFDIKAAFSMACRSENSELITVLLNKFDHSLFNAQEALEIVSTFRSSELFELLIRSFDHSLLNVKTLFNIACRFENTSRVTLLLQEFDNNLFDVKTAFDKACQSGSSEIVSTMLQILNHELFDIKKAFILACKSGNLGSVKLLLQTSDNNLFDVRTSFNCACTSGNVELVELFLETFNLSQFDAKTAFNMACTSRNSGSVKLLLHTLDHKDLDKEKALDLAKNSGNLGTVKLLTATFNHLNI